MDHRPIPMLTSEQRARFESHLPSRPDVGGCVRYQSAPTVNGYKVICVNGLNLMVHRVAFRMDTGIDPGVFTVEHTCRTHDCVRGSHLTLLSLRDNILADTSLAAGAVNARKVICKFGHPYNATNTRFGVDKKGRTARICRVCERVRYHAKRAAAGFLPRVPVVFVAREPQIACVWGHEFNAVNTRIDLRADGSVHRACRICENARSVIKRRKAKDQIR